MTTPRTITRAQYLQLLGLVTLARHHNAALNDIVAAALDITDERDEEGKRNQWGHTSDLIYSEESLDAKLGYMKITVAPDAPANGEGWKS